MPAYTHSRYQLQPASSSLATVPTQNQSAFRYNNSIGNGNKISGPNPCGSSYIYYSAPQSSYSSNRLRDVDPDEACAANTGSASAAAAAAASSYKTLTATVYYQQRQQQQQQQQQQHLQQQPASTSTGVCSDDNYENASKHSVFASVQLRKQSRFNARKKFQFAILVIRAVIRIRRLRYTAEPLHVEEAIRDPYRVKVLRKVIDGCAFRVYGHWVKKGEGQNRAALFENTPRTELHALYINNLSR